MLLHQGPSEDAMCEVCGGCDTCGVGGGLAVCVMCVVYGVCRGCGVRGECGVCWVWWVLGVVRGCPQQAHRVWVFTGLCSKLTTPERVRLSCGSYGSLVWDNSTLTCPSHCRRLTSLAPDPK